MVIKSSSAAEIRQLIAAFADSDDRDTRVAILRALESTGDVRIVTVARQALADGGDLAVTAAMVLRGLLDSPHSRAATDALDALVSAALDPQAEHRVRLAAFDALQGVPGGALERVAAALAGERDPYLKVRAREAPKGSAAADATWLDALDGRLPDQPGTLREAAQVRAPGAALGSLQKLIDAVRAKEGATRSTPRRAEWRGVRGTLHQALALRGSRLAVYDLRESVEEAREPLPVSFLAALHVVGDQSCLEALAGAYARAEDARWRVQLRDAFRAIIRRERLTRRHAVIKRIAGRSPAAVADLMA
jgi:hypothetical protein